MENFDVFSYSCSHNSTTIESVEKGTTRKSGRTICDISNVLSYKSKKLRKPSVVQKYRRVYLKKYVCSTGIKHYHRYKKAFLIPVVHVSRRPDNPFNVKTAVENLRRKQMTSPLNKESDSHQHLPTGEELCYSNLEERIPKTKNWEAIRYKYQLDYKEKLKMERENYFKEYADMKKMSHKPQNIELMRSYHQTMDIRKAPRNTVVSNEELMINSLHSNRLKNFVTSTEAQAATSSNESKKYYLPTEYGNNVRDTVDSTEDIIPVPRNDLKQIRFTRNERQNNNHSEVNQNKILIDSDTVAVPATMDHEMPKRSQCEDFDFTIPFNESNILVKVMTPERKNPNVATQQQQQQQQRQQASLLQDTLLYDTKSQRASNSSHRVTLDEQPKSDTVRPDSSSRNEWLQYIQNILNRAPQLVGQPAEKSQTNESISKSYFDHRPIPTTTTIQKTSVAHVNTTNVNSQMRRYHDSSSIGRVKVDRPVASNPRLVRPKVMHPYFRSDFLRNKPLYKEQMEDPIMVNMPVRRHSPAPMIPDQPNIPSHMEYVYANHPNYHHEFVRSMQLPMDIPHPNLMGQPSFSPYDQTYVQYPSEMERMPNPYLDRFIHHNVNVPPVNRNIGYLPPRPTATGVYRYLNPHHDHPLWIYPHVLER